MSNENHISGNNIEEKDNMNKTANKENESDNSDYRNNFYPWIKPNSKCHSLKGMLKLHYEILDFYEFIKLTNNEIKLRNKTYNSINTIIEDNFPNYKCILYGSFTTELSLPNSDIDILIVEKEESKDKLTELIQEKKLMENLQSIYTILKNANIFTNLEMINAKVPIITGLFESTNVHVDISLYKKDGIDVADIIKKITSIYPEIKPLLLLVKYILRQRNLNQIYTGGISSFIIFTLLYYYISDIRKQIDYEKERSKKEKLLTLGDLLVGFFNFYAFEFQYEKFGISISNGCHLYMRNNDNKNILSVRNFEDESQDMGINCFNFSKILDVFKLAAERLNYPEKDVVSYLKEFIFPDDTLRERAEMFKNEL